MTHQIRCLNCNTLMARLLDGQGDLKIEHKCRKCGTFDTRSISVRESKLSVQVAAGQYPEEDEPNVP